jgi:hypothetical protein
MAGRCALGCRSHGGTGRRSSRIKLKVEGAGRKVEAAPAGSALSRRRQKIEATPVATCERACSPSPESGGRTPAGVLSLGPRVTAPFAVSPAFQRLTAQTDVVFVHACSAHV